MFFLLLETKNDGEKKNLSIHPLVQFKNPKWEFLGSEKKKINKKEKKKKRKEKKRKEKKRKEKKRKEKKRKEKKRKEKKRKEKKRKEKKRKEKKRKEKKRKEKNKKLHGKAHPSVEINSDELGWFLFRANRREKKLRNNEGLLRGHT